MAGSYAKAAMARVKAIQKRNPKQTSFTATETGARRQALSNLANRGTQSLKRAARGSSGGKIQRPLEAPSSGDIDKMIKGGE